MFLIELQNKDQVLENYILIPDIPNNGSNFSSDEEVKSVISIQTPCKVWSKAQIYSHLTVLFWSVIAKF